MPNPPGDLGYIVGIIRDALADIQDEITGQIVNTANAIVDVWEIDCEGDWILYVKTATTAFGAALWLLLTPSFEEILENYLSPKPGRRHGRRGQRGDRERRLNRFGQRRLYFNPPIPDIDHAIANRIPGRDLIGSRRVGPGEHLFWSGIDVADRFLWYWLLIEASETFATTWMSEIVESGKCKALNDASCQIKVEPRPFGGPKFLWQSQAQFDSYFHEGMSAGVNGFLSMDLSRAQGHALIIVEVTATITSTDTEDPGTLEFGPTVTYGSATQPNTDTIEEWGSVTVPPGGVATATVSMARLVDDFHAGTFSLQLDVPLGSGSFTRSVTSRTAVAVRGVELV